MNPATTWALAWLRSNPRRAGGPGVRHSIHARAALLALAALADEALDSPGGYSATPAIEVGRLAGMEAETARRWLDSWAGWGVIRSRTGGYRIPEEAFA